MVNKLIRLIDRFRFFIRKKFVGFESAALLFMTMNKDSAIPILKANGATIGSNNDIETPIVFHNCQDFSNLVIGNNCHIGKNCFFDLRDKVIIQNNVVISMQTTFITHQDISRSELNKLFPASHKEIIIKDNSYIGASVTILKGVTINEYAVVGAKSLVTKDIMKYTMNFGVPVVKIKDIPKK